MRFYSMEGIRESIRIENIGSNLDRAIYDRCIANLQDLGFRLGARAWEGAESQRIKAIADRAVSCYLLKVNLERLRIPRRELEKAFYMEQRLGFSEAQRLLLSVPGWKPGTHPPRRDRVTESAAGYTGFFYNLPGYPDYWRVWKIEAPSGREVYSPKDWGFMDQVGGRLTVARNPDSCKAWLEAQVEAAFSIPPVTIEEEVAPPPF